MPPAVAAAGIAAGGSILTGILGANASKKAANAQSNAAQLGIDEQKREYDQTRTDMLPWLTAGQSALGGMMDLLGLGGADKQQSAITGLQNGPLYQSLYRNGTNTILANAAATGGLRGGNTEGSLFNLGSDLLAQVIQMQMQDLGGISGAGLNAGGSLGQLGQNSANAISGLLGQQGAAKAGGYLGAASGFGTAINGITNFLPSLFGGGGSAPTQGLSSSFFGL